MTMKLKMLKSTIKQGFVGMWRNRTMSLASIGSVTASLLILGIILILVLNINNMTNIAKEEFDEIIVFLKDDISQEQIEKIGEEIRDYNGVLSIIYQTKEQGLENWKETWGEEKYLLEGLEENPVPDSYIIQLEDIKYADDIVKRLEGFSDIESIRDYNEIVEKMLTITDFVRTGGLIIIGILMLISVFIISNTIKITVAARKKEISIMKYVGATNGFIRGPFIIEGLILGVIGSAISIFIVSYSYKYLFRMANEKLYVLFTVYMIPYNNLIDDIMIIFTTIGVGIGIVGSLISLRRFLRV